ncbi:MAG: replicative DNA helicase [Tissierellia bacterium]|nr:replicative DNA helicase [Tissierellia bacterium]
METAARILPHDENAERSVLGSMLLDVSAIGVAEEMLIRQDFYNPRNAEIFKAILTLSGNRTPVEILFLSNELKKQGQLENVGGIEYLLSLSENVGLTSNIRNYCKIVAEKSTLRDLIKASDEIMAKAYEDRTDGSDVVELAEKSIFDITQKSHSDGLTKLEESLLDTLDLMEQMYDKKGGLTGVTTGLVDLDRALSGLQKSDLVLLAARPSMGKTALGVNIAVNAALKDHVVAIFSLEMSKTQLVQRILASMSLVSLTKVISGDIDDWETIGSAVSVMEGMDLYIDDTAGISLTELRAKSRRLKAEKGLDLIVIDYLQLMTVAGHVESRQLEVSAISRGLKALAKELKCPVLALSQLSRAVEKRTPPKPVLSDLRESGSIEQDADVVMMLYREDYYDEESERPNTADVIIAKHRNGATGTVGLFYNKEITKFGNLEQHHAAE